MRHVKHSSRALHRKCEPPVDRLGDSTKRGLSVHPPSGRERYLENSERLYVDRSLLPALVASVRLAVNGTTRESNMRRVTRNKNKKL